MAEKVREQRAEARERRRSLAAKPFEELDKASDGAGSTLTPLDAAKGIAATAAAAAIAGAIAGAAKAWHERESAPADDGDDDEREEPRDAEQPVQTDEPTGDEPESEPDDDEEEPQTVPPAAEAEAETEGEQSDDDEDEPTQPVAAEQDEEHKSGDEDEGDGAGGGAPGDATRVVEQARGHLKDLFDADAESISGIERSNGNWSVTLEVVEMHRIPESTDILSSYTAVIDDDGGIVSLTRGRRYRRSQVEEL